MATKKITTFCGSVLWAIPFFIFANIALAESKYTVTDMTRDSEYVVEAKVTKIDSKINPPQATVTVTSQLKGNVPKKTLVISLLPDDSGGDEPKAEQFENGKTYLLFITQIEQQFAFLYQNLSGKIGADKNFAANKEIVKMVIEVDKAGDNGGRTKIIQKYLASSLPEVEEAALTEVQINTSKFEADKLEKTIQEKLSSKNDRVRKRALMAITRIRAAKAGSDASADLVLMKMLIDKLEDQNEEVRDLANQQLRSLTRKDFDFDPKGDAASRKEAVQKWRDWYEEQKRAQEKR